VTPDPGATGCCAGTVPNKETLNRTIGANLPRIIGEY